MWSISIPEGELCPPEDKKNGSPRRREPLGAIDHAIAGRNIFQIKVKEAEGISLKQ